MKNKRIKNIILISLALFAIMLLSTLLVISFNYFIGLNTNINNEDVSTSIAAVAFSIALLLRYFYDKIFLSKK